MYLKGITGFEIILDSAGGRDSKTPERSTKENSTGTDMFVHSDQSLPGKGAGSCASPGGWRGGWNATTECQTLCPDGIITDSSKAALHNSASSLPQHI